MTTTGELGTPDSRLGRIALGSANEAPTSVGVTAMLGTRLSRLGNIVLGAGAGFAPPPVTVPLAGEACISIDLKGNLAQAHALVGDAGAGVGLTGDLQVGLPSIILAGEAAVGLGLTGSLTQAHSLAGPAGVGVGLSGDVRTELPPIVLSGKTAVGVGLVGALFQAHALAGEAGVGVGLLGGLTVFGEHVLTGEAGIDVGLVGVLTLHHGLMGAARVGVGLRDGYVGPGTGLVTGTLTEDQFLASLREGDTFRVVVPSAVPWGRTALARVLGREIDQAGRPVLTLQLEGWPEPQRVLVQDTASVPRYQPATALDPARRIVETERAVAQVAARATE